MHRIAYIRTEEVAQGKIPFGQSNFMSLLSQTRSIYGPEFDVFMSEKIAKIVNAGFDEDYINDWQSEWTVDHKYDVLGNWNKSATSVYFVQDSKEVLFTQLFADINPTVI